MDITLLFVSQRSLRRAHQIPALTAAILAGEDVPPLRISEAEDGHHRVGAYWLSGRRRLERHEYELTQTDRPRPRFGRIPDLIRRCGLDDASV